MDIRRSSKNKDLKIRQINRKINRGRERKRERDKSGKGEMAGLILGNTSFHRNYPQARINKMQLKRVGYPVWL